MSDIKKYIIIGSICLIIGGTIGSISTYFVCKKLMVCPETNVEGTVTTSGDNDAIKHSDWKLNNKKTIQFKTISTKEGTIQTTIDKLQIPEVNKWIKYVHGIQFKYTGLIYNDGIYRHVLEPSYLYRWDWFALGGGPTLSFYENNEGKKFGGGFHILIQAWIKGK